MSHQENVQAFESMLGDGFQCSQCVFVHWARQMGLEEEFAAKISSGLGMGVNHGDSCGAVTSTVLALGLAHGFSDGVESGAKGGIEGLDLIDISSTEIRQLIKAGKRIDHLVPKAVADFITKHKLYA